MRTTLWRAVIFLALVHATVGSQWAKQWASSAQEALDERNDAAIFKAVVTSMQEWERKHHSRRRRKRAESQVCYEGLGCFQDSGPFGYLDMLPSKPEEVGTRFILYASQAEPALDVPFSNLSQIWPWAEKTLNVSKTTKVIVHGFGSDCDHVWVYEMKSALMSVENCNVICIDWGNGAAVPNYVRASANTRLVGKQLALLLAGLQNRLGLKLEMTHVIGFSLGAHVAGFAGAQLTNLSRITGLDPAGPLFESQDPRARLDSSDAMFVDVIHSNGENLILGGLGSWQPMGHVDFYPNGGRMQKGCSNLFVGAVTDILWSATEVEGRSLCNHRRAYKFFTDSLSPRCHFPAFPCESYEKFLEGGCFPCAGDKRCGNMGYYADKSNVRGTLYLITRDEEPFCAHQYHVRIESAPKVPPAVSYGKIQVTLVGSENINETFSLTQKDDAEIRVGVPLTRIAVPHPALQEPKAVELMYTAYSGWISSGLSQWSIDKLSLTDSFGKSMSVCKKGLMLETGVPVTLPLYPGECNPPRANITAIIVGPPPSKATSNVSTSSSSSLLDFFRFKPTPVVQMGDELVGQPPSKIPPDFDPGTTTTTGSPSSESTSGPRLPFIGHPPVSDDLPDKNVGDLLPVIDITGTSASDILDHPPWMPVSYVDSSHTNSLLDKDVHEDSRAFNTEDILVLGVRNRTLNVTENINTALTPAENNNRTIITRSDAIDPADITLRPEIKEPVLLSTSTRPLPWEGDASLTLNSTFRPRAISLTNDTTITTWRPEIKEPILNPTTPKVKAVKTRHVAASGNYDNRNDDWVPKQDLKPPPLGSTWHHWNAKDNVHTPFDEWRRGGSPGGAIGLVSGSSYPPQHASSVATSSIREMYASPRIDLNVNSDVNLVQEEEHERPNTTTLSTSTTPASSSSKRTGRQMLTVQLFPHRLATLLAQAERYARGHFLPYAKQKNKSQNLDLTAQKTSTVSRKLNVDDATDDGDNFENGALPLQRRPKYFPNMAEGIQNLHLNNPLQLILNIFTNNNNKSKVDPDKSKTPEVQIVQLSKTVGIAKDKPRETAKDIIYGTLDTVTVKPMQISKEHVEQSVRRDMSHAKVLVPYTHDTDKENKHKYIPLKDPTGATEAKQNS